MVVLEALEQGLPVICLKLGGPGQIVNETCGRVISIEGKSEDEVVESLAEAIMELQQDKALLKQLSEGAIKRAAEFTWKKTVARVYEKIETHMIDQY
jgi:glycosyltransferase involved in cell wall biosynthesis